MAGGAYVVIALSFGLAGGIVGKIKGSSFFIWFIIATVVPVIGLLTAIVYRSERDELRRLCPTCGRVCKLHDALCVRCGTELEFPEQALASENAALTARLTHSLPRRPPGPALFTCGEEVVICARSKPSWSA